MNKSNPEAMRAPLENTLNWEVKESTVAIDGKIQRLKALTRSDNGKLLGIVGSGYKTITNEKMMTLAKKIEQAGDFKFEGFAVFKEGKKVMAYLRNLNRDLRI